MATRRWSSKRMRIRSGLFCGSIYWVLLVSGRVSVPKPLSQIQRSTRWLLQGLSPRTSFGGFGLKRNPLVSLDLSTEEIVSSLNRAIPPKWVESVVDQAFEDVGSYVAGERDEFELTIRADEQAVAVVTEIKSLLRKSDAHGLLFDELVGPVVEEALGEKMPLALDITSERLTASIRRVVPPEWAHDQVEALLDEVTPYAVGERESFEISVELADRVEVALEEVKRLLREAGVYDLGYDDVIDPALENSLGEGVALPFGFDVTRQEIVSVLRRVAPADWVRQQAEMVIDEATPYLTGKTETFTVDVSLADNKRRARDVMAEMVRTKLNRAVEGLSECTADQRMSRVTFGAIIRIPDCIPPGIQSDELVKQIESSIVSGVESQVLGRVPDSVQFTDSLLRQVLIQAGAEENIDLLDDVRELMRDGWVYTDRDLREDLRQNFRRVWEGEDLIEAVDNVRGFLKDGWTYTERDLRKDIADGVDEVSLEDFDSARNVLGWVQNLRLLIYLPLLVVLVAIGFLGGRSWPARFAWAAASLAVVSGVVFVASGPVVDAVARPHLDNVKEMAFGGIGLNGEFQNTERLVADKTFEIAQSVVRGFASGIAIKSLIFLIVGILGLGISLGWGKIKVLARR